MTLRAGGRRLLATVEPKDTRLGELLRDWQPHEEVAVRPSYLFRGMPLGGPPLPLRCLFLIDGHGATPQLSKTTTLAAAPELLRSLLGGPAGLERLARLLHELRDVAIYRLRLGTPAASASAIREVLVRAAGADPV